MADAKTKLIREALRFANWAAGKGLCPAEGQPAKGPEDFLYEYSCATGDEDWGTLAERLPAASDVPHDVVRVLAALALEQAKVRFLQSKLPICGCDGAYDDGCFKCDTDKLESQALATPAPSTSTENARLTQEMAELSDRFDKLQEAEALAEEIGAQNMLLREALTLAADRLYEEGAPHFMVDDARTALSALSR